MRGIDNALYRCVHPSSDDTGFENGFEDLHIVTSTAPCFHKVAGFSPWMNRSKTILSVVLQILFKIDTDEKLELSLKSISANFCCASICYIMLDYNPN